MTGTARRNRVDHVPDEPMILTHRSAQTATVTLSRPEALNAMTPEMVHELRDALAAVAADDDVRVVVLTGAGRAFSAGLDLKALRGAPLVDGAVGDLLDIPGRAAIDLITTMPKVVIAKVNGFCFTGALELAISCDLVITADEAVLGDTHAKFGLRPSWGMSQRLIRLVGPARARDLSYTAHTFTGRDAAAWGLAARSVPAAELDAVVDALAAEITANSQGSIAAYKDLYRVALDEGLTAGLDYEARTTYRIPDTEPRVAAFR
jgi:enoyl-CoA hydratase